MAQNTETTNHGAVKGARQNARPRRLLDLGLVAERAERDCDAGFCRLCATEHDGIEPDARNYTCENCGAAQVFGAEELMMMMS